MYNIIQLNPALSAKGNPASLNTSLQMANPGADGDPENDPTLNPEKKAEVRGTRRQSSSSPQRF
jgi:hypothetical protein